VNGGNEEWVDKKPLKQSKKINSDLLDFIATKIPFMYSFSGNCAASVGKCLNLSQIYECGNWETEHYNSVLEIRRLHCFISGNT
jgi:hypothetical protein